MHHLSIRRLGARTRASAVASGFVLVFRTLIHFALCYVSFLLGLGLSSRTRAKWTYSQNYYNGVAISSLVRLKEEVESSAICPQGALEAHDSRQVQGEKNGRGWEIRRNQPGYGLEATGIEDIARGE